MVGCQSYVRPSLPPGISWYSFLEAESTPGTWNCRIPLKKSPMTPPGIDPWTFRLVAQCVKQVMSLINYVQRTRMHLSNTLPSHYSSQLPSTHLWRYSPFWALASFWRRLHSSLSPAHLILPRIPRICDVSFWSTSSHLDLGFPTGLYYEISNTNKFFRILYFHSCNMIRPS
jgi:hypothetical protein